MTDTKRLVSESTRPLRMGLAKLLIPQLYKKINGIPEGDQVPRPSTIFARQYFSDKPINAMEIGVSRGYNSKSILETLNISKMVLVDPYVQWFEKGVLLNPVTQKDASVYLKDYQNKIEWFSMTSEKALLIMPYHFDFIYIDGAHDYKFAYHDISRSYDILNEKGILSGHDFTSAYVDVVLAVTDFASEQGLKIHAEKSDWFIIKD